MSIEKLKSQIDKIDIYLLDQILKEHYHLDEKILDIGYGNGKNLKWFYNNKYSIFGIDSYTEKIEEVKRKYPKQSKNFNVSI